MADHSIQATGRKDEGKGASRRLRRAARIPAVVYGGNAAPKSIQLEHEKTWIASQSEWFYSSILSLDIDGSVERVLLRDMQRHPFKQQIMHLDFQRVSENEALRAAVPLHFVNVEKSPAGKAADVVVTHELNEIHVSCLPKDLPEFIEVDLSGLNAGDTIHLSQVKLPQGVEVPELKLGADHDVAVVVARMGRVEEAAAEGTEAPAAGEGEAK
ncbi:50S ribosomal protein L25/general stress protein Ctc [Cognatiluteimonas telluris]|jgi:large subunit ribosomal protein L25|uniref:50S ribosomal protein L25/general stress protein Ctc n=1 Tax=Cognatiluteimonas telluris TaxID=1104775 RepID=UPI00140A0C99|nr:50S ribosomal protein L25/general stress protein Ctc [Lysobacter telluris]